MRFEFYKSYKRSEIQNQFGGNRQSGIANCAKHPIIFIFSGKSGKQFGYEDGWDDDNYFHYSGEGQVGDMTFTKGNLALRDHVINGKEVHLFEFVEKGLWKYIDQLELVDYKQSKLNDVNGDKRRGIIFRFKSFTKKSRNRKGELRIPKK